MPRRPLAALLTAAAVAVCGLQIGCADNDGDDVVTGTTTAAPEGDMGDDLDGDDGMMDDTDGVADDEGTDDPAVERATEELDDED